jgi:hypothetical protein
MILNGTRIANAKRAYGDGVPPATRIRQISTDFIFLSAETSYIRVIRVLFSEGRERLHSALSAHAAVRKNFCIDPVYLLLFQDVRVATDE